MSETINGFVSEKWERVYQTIPDDGSPIRFKDIVKILPKFSRSTISAALNYFCFSGSVKKKEKSKKNVEYSRMKKNALPFEAYQQFIDNNAEVITDFDKIHFKVMTTYAPHRRDIIIQLKNEGQEQNLKLAQTISLNDALLNIETQTILLLQDYNIETNKDKQQALFHNHLQLYLIPLLKELPKLVDDIGLDVEVLQMLLFKRRRELTLEDYARYNEALERMMKNEDFKKFHETTEKRERDSS
jgi:hypothetical protein